MRIGIDCHNLGGYRTGAARYLMNLLKCWAKEKGSEFILYFKEQIPDDIPKSENFQTRLLRTESNAWFEHILLPRAIKKDKIDIFFSPSYVLPFKIPKKVKTAVAIHDISYEAHPEWFSWQNRVLLRQVSKKSAKKADIIFTPSQFTKNEILKYYKKINLKKIFVISLAIDESFRIIPETLSVLKKKYRVRDRFIFYVGAIFNRRFVPQIIEAFKKIKDRLPEYQLLIGGPNYTRPFIDIKNEDSIIYIDYIPEEDLVYLYNTADLFIWLSSYEGFGFPPLEAMACGVPVLSTKKTSLAEVLGDYPIWIDNPEDINEIGEKILKILKDENLRKELVEKGLAQSQRFSWQKTAEETLRILISKK